MSVRCGNREVHGWADAHHETVAQARLCFARPGGLRSIEDEADDGFDDGFDPDAAYERHLETQYADEMRWEEHQELLRIGSF